MEGLSPWELATLKVVYHRSDRGRKGFLSADDLKQLCKDLGVLLTEAESQNLFNDIDVDKDGRISFSELMSHLTNNAGHVTDMQLRAAMLNQTALVATGAAIPLILKGKTMIVLGTLFYDPVRLFRDFYVDYFHALKSKRMAGEKIAKEDIKSLMQGVKNGFKAGLKIRTTALVILAIGVDCAVGALVFLIYAKVRAQFQRVAQEKFLRMQQQQQQQTTSSSKKENNIDSEPLLSFPASATSIADDHQHVHELITSTNKFHEENERIAAGEAEGKSLTKVRTRLNRAEVTILEASSGAVAGACAGLLTPIAKRLLSRDLFWPDAGVAGRTFLRVRHGMASHAAFFSGFYFFRQFFSDIAYRYMKFSSTTFSDAIVTTAAGCFAGGCWKLASDPLKNRDDWVSQHSAAEWRKLKFATRIGIRTKGLGRQLAQTMPVTGVAFLIYEASFSYLL